MKEIVVSTCNSSKDNYGALFQSCALCGYLQDLGYKTSYIYIKESGARKKFNLKRSFNNLLLFPFKGKIKKRIESFNSFAEQTQNRITFNSKEELYSNPPKVDVYLSGSDQVWGPSPTKETLMLAFAPKGSKKISYSASMGRESVEEWYKPRYRELISDYQHVSVREDTMIDVLKDYTDKEIVQSVDPVFLKTKEQWLELAQEYKIKYKRYILVYVLVWNKKFKAKLKRLKKQTGLPVVLVNNGHFKRAYANKVLYDVSPRQFLYLLNNAEYVCSSSFHGIAMSILFNKPLLDCVGGNAVTRMQSLSRHFRLEQKDLTKLTKQDFEEINKIIENDRKNSKEYLINAIEN